jgi:hypothetical protein
MDDEYHDPDQPLCDFAAAGDFGNYPRRPKAKPPRKAKLPPRRKEREPELERWGRLDSKLANNKHRDAYLEAGRRLRIAARNNVLGDIPNTLGYSWPAVAALVLDDKKDTAIGKIYVKSGDRAQKAVALHIVICGLKILAKCYGLIQPIKPTT